MWFERLVGFPEGTAQQVRNNIRIEDGKMISNANSVELNPGVLEVPSLDLLRERTQLSKYNQKISVAEIVGDIQDFHVLPENNGAFFQAASQFNLLEMVGPHITPERGVDIYENDFTQGPACAIACGAGTIYRNYFAEVNGQIGQTENNQIDCLSDIAKALENERWMLWEMKNGYALPSEEGLKKTSELIQAKSNEEYDALKGKLKIGIQWNTDVTIRESDNNVTQGYCSALPVAYSRIREEFWETFARLVLEATYEATFHAALINYERTGNDKVFLTLVGGGAFGNAREWIFESMEKAILKFSDTPLDVKIVSYGRSNQGVRDFVDTLKMYRLAD